MLEVIIKIQAEAQNLKQKEAKLLVEQREKEIEVIVDQISELQGQVSQLQLDRVKDHKYIERLETDLGLLKELSAKTVNASDLVHVTD